MLKVIKYLPKYVWFKYYRLMIQRSLAFISCLVVSLASLPFMVMAQTSPSQPKVIITEIYANTPDSNESGHEFIELHNTTDTEINLNGYVLRRKDTTLKYTITDKSLPADGYMAIFPTFAIINGGGTIVLDYPVADNFSLEVTYPSFSSDDSHSWSLVGDKWQTENPTPGQANPLPPPAAICTATDVVVNEIMANPMGDDTIGGEFVELHNQGTSAVSLAACLLTTDKIDNYELPDITLPPDGFYVVSLADKLLNGGGQVTFITDTTEDAVIYPALGDNEAWALILDAWQLAPSSPGSLNLATAEEEVSPGTPLCVAPNVSINEILANPAGSDAEGGEFVELYNGGSQKVSLSGCTLTTDKINDMLIPDAELEPGTYIAISLSDNLLNGGGQVKFISAEHEDVVSYPALDDDEAWALIGGAWQSTTLPTPGSLNQPSPLEAQAATTDDLPDPCPIGKFRNPETNRCKTITEVAGALLPCSIGETRNAETNRCRKTSSVGSMLTPCQPGQERNPDTNRCRKVSAATTGATPCLPGQERNPDTKRCRKVTAASSGKVAGDTGTKPGPSAALSAGIIVAAAGTAMAYGIYEYRFDIGNWTSRLRARFARS